MSISTGAEFDVICEREPIMRWFTYEHLPDELRTVSMLFREGAEMLERMVPRNAERTVALRKMLEAKDAAVRAKIAGA